MKKDVGDPLVSLSLVGVKSTKAEMVRIIRMVIMVIFFLLITLFCERRIFANPFINSKESW